MNLNLLDPLTDHRWDELVARHPRASAFHQRGWLEALARTYGYEPFVLTRARPGETLADGMVICRVSSWITGSRLVSLPFSDHCDPLLNDPEDLAGFLAGLWTEGERRSCRYVELRPLLSFPNAVAGSPESDSYCFHILDLRSSLERILSNFHHDSIQRKIRRAEREGLSYEVGRSGEQLDEFYRLQVMTRRRHRRLPQPRAWFENLVRCLGDGVEIRLARRGGKAIAAILTLRNRRSVIYKYGCSDERFHNLGGMPFLFGRLVEESKARGAEAIDLGRSDWDQAGLITFKDRLGATRSSVQYYRKPKVKTAAGLSHRERAGLGFLFPLLPGAVLSAAGGMAYRHMG